jgi:hypothetical protein
LTGPLRQDFLARACTAALLPNQRGNRKRKRTQKKKILIFVEKRRVHFRHIEISNDTYRKWENQGVDFSRVSPENFGSFLCGNVRLKQGRSVKQESFTKDDAHYAAPHPAARIVAPPIDPTWCRCTEAGSAKQR